MLLKNPHFWITLHLIFPCCLWKRSTKYVSLNYFLLLSVYQGRKIVVMVKYLCAVGPVVLNIEGHYCWPSISEGSRAYPGSQERLFLVFLRQSYLKLFTLFKNTNGLVAFASWVASFKVCSFDLNIQIFNYVVVMLNFQKPIGHLISCRFFSTLVKWDMPTIFIFVFFVFFSLRTIKETGWT